jgi:hypothetical protein
VPQPPSWFTAPSDALRTYGRKQSKTTRSIPLREVLAAAVTAAAAAEGGAPAGASGLAAATADAGKLDALLADLDREPSPPPQSAADSAAASLPRPADAAAAAKELDLDVIIGLEEEALQQEDQEPEKTPAVTQKPETSLSAEPASRRGIKPTAPTNFYSRRRVSSDDSSDFAPVAKRSSSRVAAAMKQSAELVTAASPLTRQASIARPWEEVTAFNKEEEQQVLQLMAQKHTGAKKEIVRSLLFSRYLTRFARWWLRVSAARRTFAGWT